MLDMQRIEERSIQVQHCGEIGSLNRIAKKRALIADGKWGEYNLGTTFFVTPRRLLTDGHSGPFSFVTSPIPSALGSLAFDTSPGLDNFPLYLL